MKTLFFLAAIHVLCAGNTSVTVDSGNNFEDPVTRPTQKRDTVTTSLNGRWYLQPVLASDTATGKIPFLQINLSAGTFTGNTGCNNMNGSFQKTDSSFVFNQRVITTKILCTGYDEASFMRSLLHTNRYKFEKGELVLMFDATELSRWTRKPGKPVKINKA
ncbi:MAG TPA: META domain-containing protein [Chitinophagaceae bacterium]|nr:META domain-containing protein [Chitinophagaceae bacterium]